MQERLAEQVFTFFFRLQIKMQLKRLGIIISAVEKERSVFTFKKGDLCCPENIHSESIIPSAQYMSLKYKPGTCGWQVWAITF